MKKPILILFFYLTILNPCLIASEITGTVSYFKGKLKDAVVFVEKIQDRSFNPPPDPVLLNQKSLTFVPHVLPILVGTTVIFPNEDVVLHNVFSPGYIRKFNLGTYPQGTQKKMTFYEPGIVLLLCNIHHEMSAFIVIVETPYFDCSDQNGLYKITDVPPGRYRLTIWHEEMKPQTEEIELTEQINISVNFKLKK